MEAAEHFLLRSGCSVEGLVIFFDVSIRRTFTPPRNMRCSFLLQFFFAPVAAAVISRIFCVEFIVVAVLEAMGVTIHGVDGSSSPDDQMRYEILWRVCWRYRMSWEYVSCQSLAPLLRRASDTRVNIPQ